MVPDTITLALVRIMGRALPFIVPRESDAVPLIREHVASGGIVHADESSAWERLHASYEVHRVNHSTIQGRRRRQRDAG